MTDTTTLDRLEGLVQRLERLGVNTASIAPQLAPPYVAPGELIESAWGNNVVDEIALAMSISRVNSNPIRGQLQVEGGQGVFPSNANGIIGTAFNFPFVGIPAVTINLLGQDKAWLITFEAVTAAGWQGRVWDTAQAGLIPVINTNISCSWIAIGNLGTLP